MTDSFSRGHLMLYWRPFGLFIRADPPAERWQSG